MKSPFEVTGAAQGQTQGGDSVTVLRIEGFEASVAYRIAQLKELLAGYGVEMSVAAAEASTAYWTEIRDLRAYAGQPGDVWKVSCKPSEAAVLLARSGAEQCLLDWAGGLIWMRVVQDTDLRARLGAFDGHATLIRAAPQTRAALGSFHPEAPGVARLTSGLRAKFDPRGLLNPGLMGHMPEAESA
jgi:glycolate oxidase FAD binding subunit